MFSVSRRFEPQRGVAFLSRAGASGSHHLPWALPRVLQAIPKIKRRPAEAIAPPAADAALSAERVRGSAFIPGRRASAIAAKSAGKRRGNGRAGRRRKDTGRRRQAKQKRNGQSQRYRERVKSRKPPEPEAVNEPARVITTRTFFSIIRATGQAATRGSRASGEVPYNASVRRHAGGRWSACRSGSGAGNRARDLIRRY